MRWKESILLDITVQRTHQKIVQEQEEGLITGGITVFTRLNSDTAAKSREPFYD